jgi:hypothetical protein
VRYCNVVMSFALLATAAPAADWAAAAAKADPPAELAEPVRKLLDRNAVSVSDGNAVLTVWFRDAIPAKATAEQVKNGLTYREIPDGTLIGAVRFDRPFVDFRKQEVATGAYTLRFAVQPETGDHMGTAPHQEFVLLVPAAKDTTAEPLEPKSLFKASAAVTGGDHPGVLLLFPHTGKGAEPKIVDKGDGVKVLTVRRAVDADGEKTTLGFALTVAGHSKTR